MNFKPLKIGNIEVPIPIIQGGMGVGISLSNLAGAVAKLGGIGVISAAQPGYNEKDFKENVLKANIRALKKHIERAKEIAPKGIIGVNIMCAATNYAKLVKASLEAGAHMIISGAGLPLDLPSLCKDSDVNLVPIISSKKAADVILRYWVKKHNRLPDAFIYEGPKAGGHLGFKRETLDSLENYNTEEEITKILKTLEEYKEKHNTTIPLIVAGGVYTGTDIASFLKLGASGVQIGSRFVATHECDAHDNFKEAYVNSIKDNITIMQSPVGLPGRAINNKFLKGVSESRPKFPKCFNCVQKCDPKTTPFCITDALINSVKGDLDKGLIFCGSETYRIDKIVSVEELFDELLTDLKKA
ncbi:NAD(P)H-dependent flavin oxidoreductase [Oceanirhabdus seepicola]|uniref:Probable nitronate monooxygenase n=1 Tax=Oceanirhabdus seepicola TaxID=2828781 RepID=A0A9J6NW42_9CLOT|nr:nitronate monooxygenase family protein [Oceanirhabdus seepicola]MCM1988161.1 nitronate monooxygenase [Oceanirhabdus seepicola]